MNGLTSWTEVNTSRLAVPIGRWLCLGGTCEFQPHANGRLLRFAVIIRPDADETKTTTFVETDRPGIRLSNFQEDLAHGLRVKLPQRGVNKDCGAAPATVLRQDRQIQDLCFIRSDSHNQEAGDNTCVLDDPTLIAALLELLVGFLRPTRRPRRCGRDLDRKSTRLNSSHANLLCALLLLKKKDSD